MTDDNGREGQQDKRINELATMLARHEAYWEAQHKMNHAVQKAVESVQDNQSDIQIQIRATRDSVTHLTATLRWVLGVTTAVGIAVVVSLIVK